MHTIHERLSCVGLSSLGLADNRIGDHGATALADLIRYTDTLQKLVLSGNNIQDDGGSTLIAALSQNTSIEGLYLAAVGSWDLVVSEMFESFYILCE